jgi:hypothetical protein
MLFVNVSHARRRFLFWSSFHVCCHLTRKSLCHVFSIDISFTLFFFRIFFINFADHFCFLSLDVFATRRLRLSRWIVKRLLILLQKFDMKTSCCFFFIRCRNFVCKWVKCNWINFTKISISRICVDIALKLSLIILKHCYCILTSFVVVSTTLFEQSCDACQKIDA